MTSDEGGPSKRLGRANLGVSATFAIAYALSWRPLVRVFEASPQRDHLVRQLLLIVFTLTATAAAFRLLRLPWWVVPPLTVALIGVLLRTLTVTNPNFRQEHVRNPALSWHTFAIEAARGSFERIDQLKAPIPAEFGFVVIALITMSILILVGHILAFEMDGVFESLIPAAAIVVVTSALGEGQGGGVEDRRDAIAFAVAAAAHVVADAHHKRKWRYRWLSKRSPGLERSLLSFATVVAVLAVGSSAMVSRIGTSALRRSVDWRQGLPSVRKVRSPTVSLRRRLVDLSSEPMFSVSAIDDSGSPAFQYWRQAALDSFNGTSWSQGQRRYQEFSSDDDLDENQVSSTAATRRVTQRVTILGLEDEWLPSAYRPVRVRGLPDGVKSSFDKTTSSVIVSRALKRNETYEVVSRVPLFDGAPRPAAASPRPIDDTIRARYTELPTSVSPRVRELARSIVERAGSDPVAKASLLETFFLTNFTYSTSPRPSGPDALETFLVDDRVGYCEQFASAFAALARSVGLPTRVAVGFTSGDHQPDGSTLVTGKNAHTWPEVLISGAGWIAFEPTPGRDTGPVAPNPLGVPSTIAAISSTAAATSTEALSPPTPTQLRSKTPIFVVFGLFGVATLIAGSLLVAVRRWWPGYRNRARLRAERADLLAGVDRDHFDVEWAWYQLMQHLMRQVSLVDEHSEHQADSPLTRVVPTRIVAMTATEAIAYLADRGVAETERQQLAELAIRVNELRYGPPGIVAHSSRVSLATEIDAARQRVTDLQLQTREWLG